MIFDAFKKLINYCSAPLASFQKKSSADDFYVFFDELDEVKYNDQEAIIFLDETESNELEDLLKDE